MKKVISISLAVYFICCSLLVYKYYNAYKLNDLLYNDRYLLSIDFKDEISSEKFLKEVKEKSKKLNVNVSQYVFFDEKSLNIYDFNIRADKKVEVTSGNLGYKPSSYIDNTNKKSSGKTGDLKFPDVGLIVKHYTSDQLKNVGLGDTFYVYAPDKERIQSMIEFLSRYGELKLVNENIYADVPLDFRVISLVVVSVIFLLISIIYHLIKQQYTYAIKKMFGYSKKEILIEQIKKMIFFTFGIGLIVTIGFYLYLVISNKLHYISVFLLVNLLSAIGFTFLIGLFTWRVSNYIYKRLSLLDVLKGKLPFKAFNIYLLLSKLIITGITISLVGIFIGQQDSYKQKLNSVSYWQQAKNVYKINITSQLQIDDLALESKYSESMKPLYSILKRKMDAFLIDASQYLLIEDTSTKKTYAYEQNLEKGMPVYHPYAGSITVDTNYLKINPIILKNPVSLQSQLSQDNNTLNILVPEKYKDNEKEIKSLYRSYFHFQKIEVENIYNKEFSKPLNKTSEKELNVNVIYVKNNQKYFSFNPNQGSIYEHHYITDPVVIIYDGKVHKSYLGAYMTDSVYFYDNSKGKAYQNIIPYLKETNTRPYINMVSSVYKDVNTEINELKKRLQSIAFSIFCLLVLTLTLSVNYIRMYYIHNGYVLYLKFLFGNGALSRNKRIILYFLLINILSIGGAAYYFENTQIIMFGGILTAFEMLVTFIFSVYLNKQNVNRILKGEN